MGPNSVQISKNVAALKFSGLQNPSLLLKSQILLMFLFSEFYARLILFFAAKFKIFDGMKSKICIKNGNFAHYLAKSEWVPILHEIDKKLAFFVKICQLFPKFWKSNF